MISRRISQFLHAITARITREDQTFLKRWLPEESLRHLFAAMTVADQCHALRTAHTAESLLLALPEDASANRRLLVRTALLHDIGRRKGDMGTWGKVLTVLLDAAFPRWSRVQGEQEGGWLSRLLHTYYFHPRIGADMLRQKGYPEEAALIERHHAPASADDPLELCLLRKADRLN